MHYEQINYVDTENQVKLNFYRMEGTGYEKRSLNMYALTTAKNKSKKKMLDSRNMVDFN